MSHIQTESGRQTRSYVKLIANSQQYGITKQVESGSTPLSLEEMERKHIAEILERTKGVIGGKGGAAEVLGLPISTLRNRMKKLGMK